MQAVDYVAWLALKQQNFNRDDMITADLSQITMATAGILEPLAGAKTSFTPLISTSTDSEEIPVAKVEGMPDVAGLLSDFKSDGKQLMLGGACHRPGRDRVPRRPAQGRGGEGLRRRTRRRRRRAPLPPQIKTAAQPISIVVVADTDILEDRFWVQAQDFFGQRVAVPAANNGDFVANAVDVLAGGPDLISLRTRGTSARPFDLVNNIQRVADERYQATEKDLEKTSSRRPRTRSRSCAARTAAPMSRSPPARRRRSTISAPK